MFLSLVYRVFTSARLRNAIASYCPWIAAVRDATVVGDIRGGDSFADIYGIGRLLLSSLPVLSVIAIKGSIVQFPQTFGPFDTRLARAIARWTLLRSSPIIARDRDSQTVAANLVSGKRPILRSPDVAFALHPRRIPARSLPGPSKVAGTIGLNVSGLLFTGGYNSRNQFHLRADYPSLLRNLLTALLAATAGDVLLVPHTYAPAGDPESDNEACAKLLSMLPGNLKQRVQIVEGEHDCQEVKSLIGDCDFFLGSRMHSCIAALSQGVPCVGLAYSMKFRGVFESVGMANWVIDLRSADQGECVQQVLDLYRLRGEARPKLQLAAKAARIELIRAFEALLPHANPTGESRADMNGDGS